MLELLARASEDVKLALALLLNLLLPILLRQVLIQSVLLILELLGHLPILAHRMLLVLIVVDGRVGTARLGSFSNKVAAHLDINLLIEEDFLPVLARTLLLGELSELGILEVAILKLFQDWITLELNSLRDSLLELLEGLTGRKRVQYACSEVRPLICAFSQVAGRVLTLKRFSHDLATRLLVAHFTAFFLGRAALLFVQLDLLLAGPGLAGNERLA